MQTKRWPGGLLRDKRGGIAMMTALSLPILIGTAGLAAESMELVWVRRAMQRQADSAAIAGAFALSQSRAVAATVAADLKYNGNTAIPVTSVVENAPTVGTYAGNNRAVRVALSSNLTLPLISTFLRQQMRVAVDATAAVVGFGEYCVIALDPNPVAGIAMTGNADVSFKCGMIANSPAAAAVTAGGSSSITASPVAAVGGVPSSNNYASGTVLFPYSVPQQDPYAYLPDPVITGTAQSGSIKANGNSSKTISPGIYSGFNLQGNVTLNPGIYYIDGGSFSINGNSTIVGTGVTIILSSRTAATSPGSVAGIQINGNSTLQLTAPTTGTYAGVLIYQDRRAADSSNKINGNSGWKLQGAIYMPGQQIDFTGNSGMDIKCLKLVGRRLTFTGSTTVVNNCPPNTGVGSILGTRVKLVA